MVEAVEAEVQYPVAVEVPHQVVAHPVAEVQYPVAVEVPHPVAVHPAEVALLPADKHLLT